MTYPKQVVVRDCPTSDNLYKVGEHDGTYYVYQMDIGFLGDTSNKVGTARSFRDALDLIKAHSGGDNLEIGDW